VTAGHRRLSVLLVEDNALDSRLLLEALKPSITAGEVVVQTVKRLEAARLELARYDFSCVLLDLGLPDGVGVDNVRALRAAEPRAAIIVLTGLNDEKTALETMKLGAQDYLVKSEIDAGRLVKLIRQAVERHRQSLVLQTSHDHAVHAATHDELTQLPNAALFLDRARMQMIRSRSRGEPFALLCLEIDGLDLARQRIASLHPFTQAQCQPLG
jgi:PleD family two-component response regulator